MKKIGAVYQGKWFARRELPRIWTKLCGRNQDPLGRSFVDHRSVEIPDCRNSDSIRIALGLNNYFAATNRIRVKRDSIDSTIPASLGNANFAPLTRVLSLKELADKVLEILPVHRRNVLTLGDLRRDILTLDKP